jgi:hypothetical protein
MKAKPEAIRPPPDGEISAPAHSRGRGYGLGNGGLGKAAPRQGNTQLFALPGRLRRGRPMLQRAAAATCREMRAGRCDAVRAGGEDFLNRGQRTIAALAIDFDVQPFAGKRLRHINRAGGDTIATRAHTLNQDFHGWNFG